MRHNATFRQGMAPQPPLQMWGGVECTHNCVNGTYLRQLQYNGHDQREQDLELFAGLGLSAIRYPVIWESVAPEAPDTCDWSWTDERLCRLRELNVRPIAGLVHHGSGPVYARIDTPDFAPGLAHYAAQVARRYPWLEDYTPVNEPLTTARFCGLYGHWYPHGNDAGMFLRCLINECRATVLAMAQVRKVNPRARLVQTEDLGRVFGTATLDYQVEHENHRRWLSFDLLCGKVDEAHPLWDYLLYCGFSPEELIWFAHNPCPPDVVGINHYPTSDRFLDERTELYPGVPSGSNGRHNYVDVEALRVMDEHPGGFEARLQEAWERYRLPVAVTEAHLGCTREEQLRWLMETWDAAGRLRQNGADIRAVTVWSLLGAYNWNTLVTRDVGHYEPGVFDVSSGTPRPTALAHVVKALANGERPDHPAIHQHGWWRRPERLLYPPQRAHSYKVTAGALSASQTRRDKAARPLLIVGARGTLGSAFTRLCDERGLPYYAVTREDVDIHDAMAVETLIEEMQPWGVVNATGYVRVDDAECEVQSCLQVNTEAAAIMAAACAHRGAAYLAFSSDLVFDGQTDRPYVEGDKPAPLNCYGHSKALMEKRVLEILPQSLVVRASAFFGPWDQWNFPLLAVRALRDKQTFAAAEDQVVSPTYVPHLVHASLDLLQDGASGLWHLSNVGSVSWAQFAQAAAKICDVDSSTLLACPTGQLNQRARRPGYSALTTARGAQLPDFEQALAQWSQQVAL